LPGSRALAFVALAAGCAPNPPSDEPRPEDSFGAYRFSQRMPEDGSELEGQFTIVRDTIFVRSASGACLYDAEASSGASLSYDCKAFKLSFDRLDPAHKVYYTTTVAVTRPLPRCRGVRGDEAQNRCAQARNENTITLELRSGRLRAIRIGS
jgi:hypothetical protein